MSSKATLLERLTSLVETQARLHPKQEELKALCDAISSDSRLAHLNPEELFSTAKSIIRQNPKSPEAGASLAHEMLIGGGKADSFMAKLLMSAEDLVASERAHVSSVYSNKKPQHSYSSSGGGSSVITRPSTTVENVSANWQALTKEQKVNTSIWGAGALLGLFGFARAARNTVHKDTDGKNQVQWSNVSVALLQGALAALCCYMTAQALRGGHAH